MKIRVVLRFKALATRFFTDAVEKSSVASCTYLNSSDVMNQVRCNRVKITAVLGFETLASCFFTDTVEKPFILPGSP